MWTGYLLREIQKAHIAVPEEDESPLAPPPRQVLEIMVSFHLNLILLQKGLLCTFVIVYNEVYLNAHYNLLLIVVLIIYGI